MPASIIVLCFLVSGVAVQVKIYFDIRNKKGNEKELIKISHYITIANLAIGFMYWIIS